MKSKRSLGDELAEVLLQCVPARAGHREPFGYDAILKLQDSEKRAEQGRLQEEEQQAPTQAQNGHNQEISQQPTAPRAVN